MICDHAGNEVEGQVVGFHGPTVLSMPLYPASGVRFGDTISTCNARPSIRVADRMIGRVLDARGLAIDGGAPLTGGDLMPILRAAPDPFERVPIQAPIGTGVRAIDAFLTCGRGQRVGIFGGSGVGKSTLMGMMARGTSADLTVVALVGSVAAVASARRTIGALDCRVLRRPRQARSARAGLDHPLRHGAARDRAGRR
jgi:flagellum-specific ATP synthase